MNNKLEQLKKLKEERKAIILAHYYTSNEVQNIADYIGDSFFLSRIVQNLKEDVVVMCGVEFMGEGIKILNSEKKILIPDKTADCPMAHMVTEKEILEIRSQYNDLSVVTYVNSTAKLKSYSDICVTSANAIDIVSKLKTKNIYFIPDQYLGRYVASKVLDKNFIFSDGYCPIHNLITIDDIFLKKKKYPTAKIVVHPECRDDVCNIADYIGSTTGILKYIKDSDFKEFIICTENGILYELNKNNPDKKMIMVRDDIMCKDMKKNDIDKIIDVLQNDYEGIKIDMNMALNAKKALNNMLELSK